MKESAPLKLDEMSADAMISEEMLSTWIGVPIKTLQRWRLTGGGPAFAKLGHAIRYRVGNVKRWIENNTVNSTAEADCKVKR